MLSSGFVGLSWLAKEMGGSFTSLFANIHPGLPSGSSARLGCCRPWERLFYKPGEMDGWGRAGSSIGSLESQVCWVQESNHSTRTSQMPWQLESGGYCMPGMRALTKDSFPSCGLQAESSSLAGIFIGLLSYVGLDV